MKGMKSLNGYSLVDATARSGVEENAKNIQTNAQAIQTNAGAIQKNQENIQTNTQGIQTNVENITKISEELENLEQQHQSDLTTTAQNFTNQINAAVQPISEGVNTNASAIEQLSTQQSETSEKVSQNTSKLEELTQGQAGIGEQVTQLSEEISSTVQYTEQTLTEEQQMQARKNQGLPYKTENTIVHVDTTISFSEDSFNGRSYESVRYDAYFSESCTVLWDGVEYSGYGNRWLYDETAEDTGEPYYALQGSMGIMTFYSPQSGDHTLYAFYVQTAYLQKLDDNYLSSNVVTKTGDSGISVYGQVRADRFNSFDNDHNIGTGSLACGTSIELDTYSVGAGHHLRGNSISQIVIGSYNSTAHECAIIVGNGTSEMKRQNIFEVDWDGNGQFAGTVEGTGIIVKSSTADSTKRFRITVDDSGTISATEVTE